MSNFEKYIDNIEAVIDMKSTEMMMSSIAAELDRISEMMMSSIAAELDRISDRIESTKSRVAGLRDACRNNIRAKSYDIGMPFLVDASFRELSEMSRNALNVHYARQMKRESKR